MIADKTQTMESTEAPIYIDAVEVSSTTTSSVEILWRINTQTMSNVLGYRVHYQKIASSYIRYGPHLSSNTHEYNVQNLVADTYYRLCLMMYRNDTSPIQKCVDASTRSWHIPVSIGSSIGAVLALSMIVLVILLLRWPSVINWRDKKKGSARKYDSMSSHCNDDLYDFSESITITAGHDELFSDQSEGYVLELPPHAHIHQCNGNTFILHSGTHQKSSLVSTSKHSNQNSIQNGHHHHHHCHVPCGHHSQLHENQVNGDTLHGDHQNGDTIHHSHQQSSIMQDLNHNHHHGDPIILQDNDESDPEMDVKQKSGLPHAHTEPILPSTDFYEFEMQDIREVNNMPQPIVKRKYLETSIDDDIV